MAWARLLRCLLVLSALLPVTSYAEPVEESPDTRTEDIIVSATRTVEPARSVPAAPTVLTRESLEATPFRSGSQVDDLLRSVPDVQPSLLSSRYNHPTAQAVSIRGLGSRRALVLLDGVPLNDGFGGWINWGLVPDTVERIEVVPGGTSNLFGSWAMGGLIQIMTAPPAPGLALRSESLAGTLDTYVQSLAGNYGTERYGLSLAYRWYQTNGFIPVPPDQRGPVDRTNDSRHQLFTGRFRAALTPRMTLTATGGLFREDRTFGTALSQASRTIGTASVELGGDSADGHRWHANVFAQWQTFQNATSVVTPTPTLRQSELRDRIQTIPSNDAGGQFQWTVPLGSWHRLLVGTDVRAMIGQSEEQLFDATGPTGQTTSGGTQVGWGLFGEWIADPMAHLTVIPSLRVDWWRNFDGREEPTPGLVVHPPATSATVLNPKLAALYRLTDRARVAASAYQAFRAPTLNELYRGFAFGGFAFLPNSDLAPERSTGVEASVEADLLTDKTLTVRVAGHLDEVKDQILLITTGPLTAQRRNVGRTRTVGASLDLGFRPWPLVGFTAGYAYADARILSFPEDPSREGNWIPNVSPHQVTLRVMLGSPELIQITLLGRYLSRQYADDRNTQPLADVFILDASVQKQLGRYIRLYLDAENVTDQEYLAAQTGPVKTLGAPLLVMGGVRLTY